MSERGWDFLATRERSRSLARSLWRGLLDEKKGRTKIRASIFFWAWRTSSEIDDLLTVSLFSEISQGCSALSRKLDCLTFKWWVKCDFFFRSLLLTLEWRTSEEGQVICALIIIRKSGPTAMFDPKKETRALNALLGEQLSHFRSYFFPPCPLRVPSKCARALSE